MLTYCIRKEELEKEIAALDEVISQQAEAFESLIDSVIRSGAWRAIAKACLINGESVAEVARQISRTEGHVANVKTKVYRILSQS